MKALESTAGEDRRELERWLRDAYPVAYRSACLILHNRADAEEAVQDALLRAWRFRDSLPGGEAVRPWMYRLVVNSCLSKMRSERTGRSRRVPLERGADVADGPDPAEWAEMGETRSAVMSALAALPGHLRVAVVLRYYAGLSEREIAEVIQRRPGTVKSRVHEAKALLSQSPLLSGEALRSAHHASDGTTGATPR